MSAGDIEFCFTVIELPDEPVIRVMTFSAFFSKCGLMDIGWLMTIVATGFNVFKLGAQMTTFTTNSGVLTDQWKITQIMIKSDV